MRTRRERGTDELWSGVSVSLARNTFQPPLALPGLFSCFSCVLSFTGVTAICGLFGNMHTVSQRVLAEGQQFCSSQLSYSNVILKAVATQLLLVYWHCRLEKRTVT